MKGTMRDAKEIIKITKVRNLLALLFIESKIQETTNDLQSMADQINNLQRRSPSIVPIYLRTNPIAGQRKQALLLADIKIGHVQLKKGEVVTILDNWGKHGTKNQIANASNISTNRINWLVEKTPGESLLVPSVALWIPGPDSETALVIDELDFFGFFIVI